LLAFTLLAGSRLLSLALFVSALLSLSLLACSLLALSRLTFSLLSLALLVTALLASAFLALTLLARAGLAGSFTLLASAGTGRAAILAARLPVGLITLGRAFVLLVALLLRGLFVAVGLLLAHFLPAVIEDPLHRLAVVRAVRRHRRLRLRFAYGLRAPLLLAGT
jgi:hypothetical protein